MIDLIYGQDAGQRPDVIITDTGSYSDIVFALITLLGFDYRPQLAELPDAKLWRIAIGADYGPLNAAARGKIDLARIERQWPDILRVVASIHTGAVPAYDILRVLALGGMPTQLGDALAHYGRIFKTLHVLSYVDDEPYRREIKGMRDLQEGRHDLARTMFHGRKGELRQGYRDGMEGQLGALGLILNTITLWNTIYLDHAFGQLRTTGYPVLDADVARRRRRRACRHTCAATSTSGATTPSPPPTSPASDGRHANPTHPTRIEETRSRPATPQGTGYSLRGRDESG